MFSARTCAAAVLVALVAVALFLLSSRPATGAHAQQITLLSVPASTLQDTWIDEQESTANYGDDVQLRVGRIQVGRNLFFDRRALIQFDLSGLPSGATIASATLTLKQIESNGAADGYLVYPDAVLVTWDELEVNWDTDLPYSQGDPAVLLSATNETKSWNVTNLVTNWAAGEIPNFGILLRGDGTSLGERVFGSSDNPDSAPPTLAVEYRAETTPPAISNIQPSTWVTTTQSPTVTATVVDADSGLDVSTAFYRYSTNGGTSWIGPQAALVTGTDGTTAQQTITAANVPFGVDSGSQNLIEFGIADMVGNIGTAQATIRIDTTPPTPPTSLTSSSHTLNVWSNDNTVTLNWSGAADNASGLNGYSVLFDQNPAAMPPATVTANASPYTGAALADASDWFAHVRVRDGAGNWSGYVTRIGPLKIDTAPPSNPTAVTSSHTVSVWSNDPTITMNWSGAADSGGSGVSGYSYQWSSEPAALPDTIADTSGTTATSSPFASRNDMRFHVRTRDAAGNWSATAVHRGPYFIDVTLPWSSASSPATSSGSSFTVSWLGSDAHSGVGSYDVQYRDKSLNGSWTNWKSNTTATSSTFYGLNGHIYEFRSRVRDKVGNLEAYPSGYDSQTSVNNVDVWARNPGIEVNQAVQDLNNSVTLIAGKRTFVRAYVQSDSALVLAVPARLKIYRNGVQIGVLSPSNPGGTITVLGSPSRSNLNHAYYFDVPTAWLYAGSVTFQFEINTPQKYAENDFSNNTRSTTVNFVNAPTMNLLIVDVRYSHYAYPSMVRMIRDVDRTLLESWLRRAFPVKAMNVSWGYWDPPYVGLPTASKVNSDLSWHKAKAIMNGEDKWKRYYGMAINTGGFMRGLAAGVPSTVASGPTGPAGGWDTDASFGDWYGGHELGHTYGRRHVTGAPYAGDEQCGGEHGPDVFYPYPGGDISPTQSAWASNAIYGFDASGPTVVPPSWKDVMTYCEPLWVSDYTYEAIYNRMKAEKPFAAAEVQALVAAGVEHLAVFGTVDMPTDTVTLEAFYRVPNSFDVFERDTNGEYSIHFFDAGSGQLANYPFSVRFSPDADEPTGFITEFVPWVSGTRRVEIWHGNKVLASRAVSTNAPTVTVTSPNGGETFSGNNLTVTWTANDDDGDPLTYSLDYSRDGGVTWEPLSASVTATQATLDLSLLPGTTQGRFRVWASDGVNTAVDQSNGNFTVAGKPPKIVALAPASGKTYVLGQTVTLEGQAYDAEDGMLPDHKLEWSSNLTGTLGTGSLLQTADLTLGTHTITLKATDGNNNVVQATTTVVITEEPVSGSPTFQIFLPLVVRSY